MSRTTDTPSPISVNIRTAGEMLDEYLDNNTPCFFWGPPGTGKSDKIKQAAKKRKMGLVDFRAVLRDSVDMRGIPVADIKKGVTRWLPPEELPQEGRDGKTGILFLDELNAAHPQTQAACFGLVLDRVLGDYHLPKGWRVVAAGNRQSDRSAAQRMPRALANRFSHIEVEADAKVWVEDYALDNCDPILSAFIRFRPELIHDMEVDDERMFPSPRQWAEANKYIPKPDHIRPYLIRGLVGAGAAAELEGFIEMFRKLPDLDDIVKRPTTAIVPDDIGALYAVSTGLGRIANRGNFDAVMKYASRLSREHEIIVGLDATRRDESLVQTKAYVEFTKRNKDIQIGSLKRAA